jgi:CobW/HypB/UreG, nucleotide-binding domain
MYIPLLVVLVSAFRFSNAFGPLPLKAVRPFVSKTTKAATNNGNASSDAPAVLASSTTSKDRTIPITLLSGFLGAGKTCALKNLLENKDDLKIGVIVNDVAKINIDAKLVAGQAGDLLELQNGCVCCSLSSELVFAVEKLISGRSLDAIVVELTGIADPKAIKQFWSADLMDTVPATIENIVTLIDSTTFGTDYMTWDMAAERRGWVAPGDSCAGNHKISELLGKDFSPRNMTVLLTRQRRLLFGNDKSRTGGSR